MEELQTVWLNIDEDGTMDCYDTKAEADKYASKDREACKKVTWTKSTAYDKE